MGGEQHRLTQRSQVLDNVPGLVPRRRVEAGGRFVQEEHFRVACQGDRHVQTALLAARELDHADVALGCEADELDHLIHGPGMGVVAGVHDNRLGHGQILFHSRRLQDNPDLLLQEPGLLAGIQPEHPHLATVAVPVALQDLNGAGLAGTVGPEHREDLTAGDLQVNTPDRPHVPVGLGQCGHLDDCRLVIGRSCHHVSLARSLPPNRASA